MIVHYAQSQEMKGMEKMREFVIFSWLCSMAEQLKLSSNPSSQCLQRLVCCYVLYIFVNNTHKNTTNRWMDHKKMRARQHSQEKINKRWTLTDFYLAAGGLNGAQMAQTDFI